MTQDREALVAMRAELQRKTDKRRDVPGFAANTAKLDQRIAEINALLAEPTDRITSLAGQALGDKTSSPREKSLAASVLSQAD